MTFPKKTNKWPYVPCRAKTPMKQAFLMASKPIHPPLICVKLI